MYCSASLSSGCFSNLSTTSKKSKFYDRIIHRCHSRICLHDLCAAKTRKILITKNYEH